MAESTPPFPLHHAVLNAARFLEDRKIPNALVGGLAVAVWGEPRATFDVDIAVATSAIDVEQLTKAVRACSAFALQPEVLRFARLTLVRAHVMDSSTIEPDLILIDFMFLEYRCTFVRDLSDTGEEVEVGFQSTRSLHDRMSKRSIRSSRAKSGYSATASSRATCSRGQHAAFAPAPCHAP